MDNDYYERLATNDTAHGGNCLTPADLDEQAERDELVASLGSDQTMQDVRNYLAGVKRLGLAMQQLGRRCDQ